MFFVFNKPKIYSYLIVFSTVVVLFFTAEVLSEANNIETLTTSAQIEYDNNVIIDKLITNKKEIVLFVYCENTNKNVDEILNVLEKNKINACFGICGEWVKKYPELTININKKCNSIVVVPDNYNNINKFEYNELLKNISDGVDKIDLLLGKELRLIGYPYNKCNENIKKIAKEKNFKIITGNIDTLDYNGLDANEIWNNIKNKITTGDIILINSNSEHAVEETKIIIDSLISRGYEFVTLEKNV